MSDVGSIKFRVGLAGQQQFSKQVNSLKSQIGSSSGGNGSSLMAAFGKLGGVIAAAFSVKALISFSKQCLDLASDLQEVQNVVDVTFGDMSDDVNAFAQSAASAFGLSETMAKKYMGTFGAMAKSFGYTTSQAEKMSEELTGMVGDVASFYNLDQDVAYTKLKAVFTGETEGLKELGVVMTQTALDQYAMENGFGKTTKAMTEQEKVSLRMAFVMDKLSAAQGDFSRTSDGWANQMRVLNLQWESLKANLGNVLITVLTPMLKSLNTLLGYLVAATAKLKEFVNTFMGVKETVSGATMNIETITSGVDNLGESIENASNKASFGFDNLNKLTGAASGAGAGGLGGSSSIIANTEETKKENDLLEKKESIIDKIRKKLEPLQPIISAFVDGGKIIKEIVADVREHFDHIWNTLKDAWERVVKKFEEHDWSVDIETIAENIQTMFNIIKQGYETFVEPVIEDVEEWIDDYFGEGGQFDENVEKILTSIDLICQNSEWFFTIIGTLVALVMKLLANIFRFIVDNITYTINLITGIVEVVAGVFELIEGLVQQDQDKISHGFKVMLQGILDFLVNGILQYAAKQIQNFINDMIDLVNLFGGNFEHVSFASKIKAPDLLGESSGSHSGGGGGRSFGTSTNNKPIVVNSVLTLDGKVLATSTNNVNRRLNATTGYQNPSLAGR